MTPANLQRLVDQIVISARSRVETSDLPTEWIEGYAIGQLSLARVYLIDIGGPAADFAACVSAIELAEGHVRELCAAVKKVGRK